MTGPTGTGDAIMHEMTIVTNILKIVEDRARGARAGAVTAVELEVGELAGVEIDSLRFCFEAARRDTLAAGAELIIHRIAGLGRCPACAKETPLDYAVAVCPECGQARVDVIQGKELKVKCISVDGPD